jgi:hypothetical protein
MSFGTLAYDHLGDHALMDSRLDVAGSDRRGVAIIAVVFLMLAVTLLAHGLLLLAELELETSRAGAASTVARFAAQVAALDAAADSGAADRHSTPLWASSDSTFAAVPDSVARDAGLAVRGGHRWARLIRLSREVWLAEGHAEIGGLARHLAARPYWIADAPARVAAAEAALVSESPDSTLVEGMVDATDFLTVSAVPPPIACDSVLAAVDSLRVVPMPPLRVAAPGTLGPALGPLTIDSLAARATAGVGGTGTPAPNQVGSVCVTGPWNWGDPLRPLGPCGHHVVVVAGADGLRVLGGVGQGLLVLRGSASLTDLDFRGMVVAAGRLTLLGSTRIRGLVRASGGVGVGPGARVDGSACWAAAALAHPALRTPSPIPASGWIDGR